MSLTYYYHPLSSFCWKVLIAFYENDTPFTPHVLHLQDPQVRADFAKLSPMGKMPALLDGDRAVWEASIVIEYLDAHHSGSAIFIPADPEQALEVRRFDRMFDLYIHEQMQKIVSDRLRLEDKRDPFGVEEARTRIERGYDYLETVLRPNAWAVGDAFSLADCAAAPALFYANVVQPIGGHRRVGDYLERLKQRPSFARTLAEARPYFKYFPGGDLQ